MKRVRSKKLGSTPNQRSKINKKELQWIRYEDSLKPSSIRTSNTLNAVSFADSPAMISASSACILNAMTRISESLETFLSCARRKLVRRFLNEHPRLYREVPWGAGGPGMFMLICGDCKYRNRSACTNPQLKANGGEGLEIILSNPPLPVTVCFNDGTRGSFPTPATKCAGFEKK